MTRHRRRLRTFLLAAALVAVAPAAPAHALAPGDDLLPSSAQALAVAAAAPPGFTESTAWGGLVTPTALRFAPDGRVFVALKSGIVNVYDDLTDQTPTRYTDLSRNVDDFLDRGLLGLAIDPNFTQGRPYIYVLYTYDKDPNSATFPRWNDNCPTPPGADGDGCVVTGRLSRISADGSEQVLIEDWCNQYSSHTVGSLNFGPDGALYASAGDGASFTFADYGQDGNPVNPCGDPPGGVGGAMSPPTAEGGALRSQSFRRAAGRPVTLDGTIIRVNPDTGAAMPDNPAAGDANANRRRIVAYGVRNPFRFAFRPGTSEIWFGDVGWNTWEEVNRIPDVASARNYGWPCYEGAGRMGSYDALNLNSCESLYTAGTTTAPYYTYAHGATLPGGSGCSPGTSSVTGVAFYTGTKFPAEYRNALFVADYARDCILVLTAGTNGLPDPATARIFASGVGGPVDLQLGPDGALYYVDLEGGKIQKIAYPAGNDAPTARATATPDHGPTPLSVAFSGAGSTDPNGDPLTYSWDLDGNGSFGDSTSPTPSFMYTTPGNYTARLRVTDPGGATDIANVPITAGNTPMPTIDAPTNAFTWAVGDPIAFSGSAVDGSGNPILPSGLSWQMNTRHCARIDPDNCHTHFGPVMTGVASGTFVAPNHDYPSRLEIVLTATDANGLSASKTVVLQPKTVDITLASDPPGAELSIGPDTGSAPFTERFIQNATTDITAVTPQDIAGVPHTFASWNDGAASTHTITVPRVDTTYTASFSRATEIKLAGADITGANVSQADTGRGEVYRTTGAAAGNATKLRLFVDGTSTASRLTLGLYADASGQVGGLLAQGTTTTVTPGAWNEVTLGSSVPIAKDAAYWIGLLNPSTGSGVLRWRDRAGGTGGAEQTSGGASLATLPQTWTSGGQYTDGPVSGYAVGPPAGPPPPPELSVTPTTLAFSGVAGGAAPAPKTVLVSNSGGSELTFTATDDQGWIAVTPTSGPAATDLTVSINATGLSAGTYTGTVTVTAPGATGSPKSIPITLTLTAPPPPTLATTPASLSFSATAGGSNPSSQSVSVANGGSGSLSFTATDDAPWLSVAPTSGSAPATIAVSVNVSGLAAGTYTATVTISSPGAVGSPQTIPVTLAVAPPGGDLLAGTQVVGSSTSAAQPGAGEVYRLTASATGSASKLRVYLEGNSAATQVVVGIYADSGGNPTTLLGTGSRSGLTAGAWNEVTLNAPVQLTSGTAYWFALLNPSGSSGQLRWRDRAGGTGGAEQTSQARNLTTLPTTWATGSRFTDGPLSGAIMGTLAPPPSPVLSVTPSSLGFAGPAGGAAPATRTLTVANTGGGSLSFTATDDASWLTVTPATGSAPRDLTASVDTTGMSAGTYAATITVAAQSAAGSPKTIPVTLTLTAPIPPALAVTPLTLSFAGQVGSANPAASSVSVTNSGGGSLSFTASDDRPWISASPANGSAPSSIAVAIDTAGLTAGTHTGSVTIDAGAAGTRTVSVTLTLTAPPPPSLSVVPSSLSFAAVQNGAAPPSQTVAVSNTGSGTLPFTVSDDAPWLSVTPTSGTANATVTVSASPAGLAPGNYNATVTVNGGAAGTRTVAVSLTVSAPATGLVGAWGFDESNGPTATDASGNNNLGTIAGATRTTAGRYGGALDFDGINDWVTVADSSTLRLTNGMTIEGWVNPTANGSGGTWRTLAVKEAATGLAYALYPYGDGGFASGHAFTAAEQWARSSSALAVNTWTHVATTYDGSAIRLYVNGTLASTRTQTGNLIAGTGPLRFGGNALWPEWFRGTLDEIRVYNRALSATDLQTDMSRSIGGTGITLTALATAGRASRAARVERNRRTRAVHRKRGVRRNSAARRNPGVQRVHYRAKGPHKRARVHRAKRVGGPHKPRGRPIGRVSPTVGELK